MLLPAISTLPEPSNVAVCSARPPLIEPVFANVPLPGSYNSAVGVRVAEKNSPPVSSSLPLPSKAEANLRRGMNMDPVDTHCGSTIAGYATPLQATRTVQLGAPGRVTGRPHGAAGWVSYAQPSIESAAWCRLPTLSTTNGGAMRSRG